jgi:hypothetical protein
VPSDTHRDGRSVHGRMASRTTTPTAMTWLLCGAGYGLLAETQMRVIGTAEQSGRAFAELVRI